MANYPRSRSSRSQFLCNSSAIPLQFFSQKIRWPVPAPSSSIRADGPDSVIGMLLGLIHIAIISSGNFSVIPCLPSCPPSYPLSCSLFCPLSCPSSCTLEIPVGLSNIATLCNCPATMFSRVSYFRVFMSNYIVAFPCRRFFL